MLYKTGKLLRPTGKQDMELAFWDRRSYWYPLNDVTEKGGHVSWVSPALELSASPASILRACQAMPTASWAHPAQRTRLTTGSGLYAHRPQRSVQRSQGVVTLTRSGGMAWGPQACQLLIIPDLGWAPLVLAAAQRPPLGHFLSLGLLAVSWLRPLSPLSQETFSNHLQGSLSSHPWIL